MAALYSYLEIPQTESFENKSNIKQKTFFNNTNTCKGWFLYLWMLRRDFFFHLPGLGFSQIVSLLSLSVRFIPQPHSKVQPLKVEYRLKGSEHHRDRQTLKVYKIGKITRQSQICGSHTSQGFSRFTEFFILQNPYFCVSSVVYLKLF